GAVLKWRCSMPASFDQAWDGEPRRSAAAPEDAETTADTQTATSNATARPGATHRCECRCSMKLLSIVRMSPGLEAPLGMHLGHRSERSLVRTSRATPAAETFG